MSQPPRLERSRSTLAQFFVVEPETNVTVITEGMFMDDPAKAMYPIRLDFSSPKFKLVSLKGLDQVKPSAVKEIDLSGNELHELGFDVAYTALRVIRAPHNVIETTALVCRRLCELYLSHNKLTAFPDMSMIPLLEVLDISHNPVLGSFAPLLRGERKLKQLNVSHCRFAFESRMVFDKELGIVKQLSVLTDLHIKGNPFANLLRNYRSIVITACPKIEELDGMTVGRDEVAAAMEDLKAGKDLQALDSARSHVSSASAESASGTALFGLTLTAVAQAENASFPGIVDEIVGILESNPTPDMFEKEPNASDLRRLKKAFEVSATEGAQLATTMPPEVSGRLLRDFFSSLVEPPIPLWAHASLLTACQKRDIRTSLTKMLNMLPPANRPTIERVCELLETLSQRPQVNKDRLRTLWGNLLLGRTTNLSGKEKMEVMVQLLAFAKLAQRLSASSGGSYSSSSPTPTPHKHTHKQLPVDKVGKGGDSDGSGSYSYSYSGSHARSGSGSEGKASRSSSGTDLKKPAKRASKKDVKKASDADGSDGSGSGSGAGSGSYSYSYSGSGAYSYSAAYSDPSASPRKSHRKSEASSRRGDQSERSGVSGGGGGGSRSARSRHRPERSGSIKKHDPLLSGRSSHTPRSRKSKSSRRSSRGKVESGADEGSQARDEKGADHSAAGSDKERGSDSDEAHSAPLSIPPASDAEDDAQGKEGEGEGVEGSEEESEGPVGKYPFVWDKEVSSASEGEGEDDGEEEEEGEALGVPTSFMLRVVTDKDERPWATGFPVQLRNALAACLEVPAAGLVVTSDTDPVVSVAFHLPPPHAAAVDTAKRLQQQVASGALLPKLAEAGHVVDKVDVIAYEVGGVKGAITLLDLSGLADVAPKAAEWMQRLDKWVGVLDKSNHSLATKSDLLLQWKARLARLETRVRPQPGAPGHRSNAAVLAEHEEKHLGTYPFVWDDESDDEEGRVHVPPPQGDSEPAMPSARYAAPDVGVVDAELRLRRAALTRVQKDNHRLKQALQEMRAKDQRETDGVHQVAQLAHQHAHAQALLDAERAEVDKWTREVKKLKALLHKQRVDMGNVRQEVEVQRKLREGGVGGEGEDGASGQAEQVVRYKIALESAQEGLIKSQQQLKHMAAQNKELERDTRASADNNDALRRAIELKLEEIARLQEENAVLGKKAEEARMQGSKAKSKAASNLQMSAELKAKDGVLAMLRAKVARLEEAIARFVPDDNGDDKVL